MSPVGLGRKEAAWKPGVCFALSMGFCLFKMLAKKKKDCHSSEARKSVRGHTQPINMVKDKASQTAVGITVL